MKLASLSKTARTLTLITMLSVMVGTSMQQSAQAQNSAKPESKVACVPLTSEEALFSQFTNITLSQEQEMATKKINDELSKKSNEVSENARTEVIENSSVDFASNGTIMPAGVWNEMMDTLDTLQSRDNAPPAKTIEVMTQKYGQFGDFFQTPITYFTSEQIALLDKLQREAEAQVLTVLTPDQQKTYRANLLRLQQVEACNPPTRLTEADVRRLRRQAAKASTRQLNNIVDIAATNPDFSTLVKALKASGFAQTLSGEAPFTVFAPTNEAFAALPKGTLEKLLRPENWRTLRKILTYHVVDGNVLSKELRSGRVATFEGSPISVQVRDRDIKVNNANVVRTDIKGSNGVIHVIDQVILPPDLKL